MGRVRERKSDREGEIRGKKHLPERSEFRLAFGFLVWVFMHGFHVAGNAKMCRNELFVIFLVLHLSLLMSIAACSTIAKARIQLSSTFKILCKQPTMARHLLRFCRHGTTTTTFTYLNTNTD